MKKVSGLKLIEEIEGTGQPAAKGDRIEFESQGFLSHGDRIQDRFSTTTTLGHRQLIPGIEYGLEGMREGGYRKIRISPHLAYRDEGVVDRIPPNAVLIYELWLTKVEKQREVT